MLDQQEKKWVHDVICAFAIHANLVCEVKDCQTQNYTLIAAFP